VSLDAPYDRLQALPRGLWVPAVTTSAGRCDARLAHLKRWLDALVAGALPDIDADFGDAAAAAPLRRAVGELDLPELARGTPALAEQVLRTVCWHLDRIVDLQPRLTREAAIAQITAEFRAGWQIERQGLDEALALLQGLGDLTELRWDELQGRLQRREWREAARLDALLQQLQPLVELIRALGRAHREPGARRRRQAQAAPARPQRVATVLRETRLPDAPGELRGIRHSDRLERMLGSEAAQIRHRVLHKLWRAHLAESRLLTYHSEAVLLERVPDPSARGRPAPAAAADEPLARGPILLAIDTSGSMKGAPENVAKAIALQALRTAHRECRRCLLLAFGGPGELVERELALTPAGLDAVLDLVGQTFDGGTDVAAPIQRAIELVHEREWAGADLLIVSDGEYGCTPEVLARLDLARAELALRVQGVLVGDRETMGLLDSCDDIYWLRDWRRYALTPAQAASGARDAGFTPVHSQSLTALYFPNALSDRARRVRGV
jgi:uncharacterized protein with von Willebrand factor type A (vWA) domain